MPANNGSPEMAPTAFEATGPDRYAPTSWGARYEDLTCPSGQTCKVRRIGVEELVADGSIDDLDSLSKFVAEKHITPKAKSVVKGRSGNPAVAARQDAARKGILGGASVEDVRRMFRLMDNITMAAVVAPKLYPAVPEAEREPGKIYVSDVDSTDKAYIMNYVFAGVKDLEQFRSQLAANVAAMGNVEGMEMPTESDPAAD